MQTINKTIIETLEHLYDLLMYDIEQDLLLENIQNIDRKYSGESEAKRSARLKKYRNAIQVFYGRLNTVMKIWEKDLKTFLKKASIETEKATIEREKEYLSSVDFQA